MFWKCFYFPPSIAHYSVNMKPDVVIATCNFQRIKYYWPEIDKFYLEIWHTYPMKFNLRPLCFLKKYLCGKSRCPAKMTSRTIHCLDQYQVLHDFALLNVCSLTENQYNELIYHAPFEYKQRMNALWGHFVIVIRNIFWYGVYLKNKMRNHNFSYLCTIHLPRA
jgi:hypothetical protein